MDNSFVESEGSPSVYKVRYRPSELTAIYHKILENVSVSDVYTTFCRYVTSSIEPIGWHAIWRSVPNSDSNSLSIQYDFEVEVMDILHNKLEAVAVVLRLIHPNESELTAEQFDEKESLLRETKIVNIPLTQLYVISDGDVDGEYRETAFLIEQIRFFYQNLWRPWDELSDSENSSEIFVETRLSSRLQLSFDIKDKLIPVSTVNRVRKLLAEAWDIKNQLESIDGNRRIESFNVSIEDNSDIDYISENDLVDGMRLKIKLEDIEREMKLLEDKHMRIIATSLKKSTDYTEDEDLENTIHIVAKSLTVKTVDGMMSSLLSTIPDESEAPIRFHKSLTNALRCSRSGDKIYATPGVYTCPMMPWIESNIEIIGFGGTSDKIVFESNDSVGEVFINCNAQNVVISGLTLRATTEMQCLVMIHSGFVRFVDCVLDGSDQTRNALIASSKAKSELRNCQIVNEKGNGIISRQGSVVINRDIELNLDHNESPVDKTVQMEIAAV